MITISPLLLQSQGKSLTSFIQSGLVEERPRALIGNRAGVTSIHRDRAALFGVAKTGSHACCIGNKVFLGPTIGTPFGPTLSEALNHELAHVAQVELARKTGHISSLDSVENEAFTFARERCAPFQISQGASPEEIYSFWWLLPLAAAAYVRLRPNVANAPGPGGKSYPSVSEAQVGGEALALFAVPEASFGIARLGLGFYGSMALAGATSTMSFRAVGDISQGEFSGVQTYVIDGATGAIIGVIVPGGIRLIGEGATRSLDWLATQGMRQSDFAISEMISQRAADPPVTANELGQFFQRRNLTGRAADWWLNRRGFITLYRGQGLTTTTILSPLARTEGLEASEQLVARMREAGFSNQDIAGQTAFWHDQPVTAPGSPPGLEGEPLGAVGVQTSRIPGVAANFGSGKGGVVYIIRLPKSAAIRVPAWGMSVEHEYVILNRMPPEAVIQSIPAFKVPALELDPSGRLIPALKWTGSSAGEAVAADAATPSFSGPTAHPSLTKPQLPL